MVVREAAATQLAAGRLPELQRVTLFVPTYNEEFAIVACLETILAQDYPFDSLEVLVVDGMSEDQTVARVKEFVRAHAGEPMPTIRIVDNPERDLASAWNIVASEATGDFIGLVVAHSFIASDYVSNAVGHLREGTADVVGGPYQMTGETLVGRAIAAAMSCPFGVGRSVYRYARDVPDIDSVANAIYPLALLRRFLPFDRTIGKGEDWELHFRMRQAGVHFAQFVDIRHEFRSRQTLRALWRQQWSYARAKINITRKHSWGALRPTHLVPLAFVSVALLLSVLAVFHPLARSAWLAGAALYGVASLCTSLALAPRYGWRLVWLLPPTFLCMHLSYGLGMLRELLLGRRAGKTSPEA